LETDEKMGDDFINYVVNKLVERYTFVNSPNLIIENFTNNQTFSNLVKICYGTLLKNAV
jgi:hypothetical protein